MTILKTRLRLKSGIVISRGSESLDRAGEETASEHFSVWLKGQRIHLGIETIEE